MPRPWPTATKGSEMKKTKRKGRAPFIERKETNFLTRCREGNRLREAFWASVFLKMLARSTKPIKKTGTVADWFLNVCIAAWKKSNADFFKDIARTIENGTENVYASPAAYNLWLYFAEHPFESEEKSRIFSIGEIHRICGTQIVSESTAGRLAHDFGLKIRPKGAHGKKWQKVTKFGT
jgi:hypothetical protein